MPVWHELAAIEQSLLIAASREQTLDQACVSWSLPPPRLFDVQVMRTAARGLVDRGLIGFYLVQDGYPDLTTSELTAVLAANACWDSTRPDARGIGLYLTPAGEDVVLGP